MAIPGSIGRGVGWLAQRPMGMAALGGAAVVAAGAGVAREVTNPDGPYGDIQEAAFGDRNAIRYSMKAGLLTAFDRDNRHDIAGDMDYYYGQPVNPSGMRSSGGRAPISGDTVLGLYNLRRG